jgi:hypothetical protein
MALQQQGLPTWPPSSSSDSGTGSGSESGWYARATRQLAPCLLLRLLWLCLRLLRLLQLRQLLRRLLRLQNQGPDGAVFRACQHSNDP